MSQDLLLNFLMFIMKKLNITSQVENPLTWILVEPSLYQQDVDSSLVSSGGQTIPGGHSLGQPRHWPLTGCGGQKQETSQTMSENPVLEWNTKFRVARW